MNSVNEYSGNILGALFPNGNVVRGNTYPVTITLKKDSLPVDITGYQMYLSFDQALTCDDLQPPYLEKEIPIANPSEGIFSGSISDDDTFSLPNGYIYISVKYIDNAGQAFIVDMVKAKVDSCLNPKRA